MAGHISKKTKVVTAPAKASASSKGKSIKNIVPAAKVVKEAAVAVATKVDEEDSDSDDSSSSSEEESSEEELIKNIVPAAKVVKEATVAVATEEEEEDSDSDDSASSSEEEEDSEDSSEESDEDEDDDEVAKEKVVVAGELKDVEEPEEMDEVTGQPKFKMGRIERRKRAEKAVAEDQAKALAESLKVRDEMLPPPKGYPTAEKALEDSIVNLGKVGEDEKVSLVCVICPTKRLQEGTMLTVHLNGKVSFYPLKLCPLLKLIRCVSLCRITNVDLASTAPISRHQSSRPRTDSPMLELSSLDLTNFWSLNQLQ
jgi:hypothetical protein